MSPVLPPHVLDLPGSLKVLLGKDASDAIAANGDYHLAVVAHPDATSPPEANGRLVLILLPCTRELLDSAHRVATGKARAVTIKNK